MKATGVRHYSEEELLMHLLREETVEVSEAVRSHLDECDECLAVYRDYERTVAGISRWRFEEPPREVWESDRERLLEFFRSDQAWLRQRDLFRSLRDGLQNAWAYALENPLPTLGYIIVAIAFASERTFSVLGLERLVPATTEVLAILKQFF